VNYSFKWSVFKVYFKDLKCTFNAVKHTSFSQGMPYIISFKIFYTLIDNGRHL